MIDVKKIKEHAAVVGSDGQHVGTIDHVEGDRIKLTRTDSQAGGVHHYLPTSSVASADGEVRLNMTAVQAKAAWKTE